MSDHEDDEEFDGDVPDECGFSYDHTAKIVDECDGETTYVCTNCGAEWSEGEVVFEPVEVPEWDDGPTLSDTVQQLRDEERA